MRTFQSRRQPFPQPLGDFVGSVPINSAKLRLLSRFGDFKYAPLKPKRGNDSHTERQHPASKAMPTFCVMKRWHNINWQGRASPAPLINTTAVQLCTRVGLRGNSINLNALIPSGSSWLCSVTLEELSFFFFFWGGMSEEFRLMWVNNPLVCVGQKRRMKKS